jgi:hypothetical protein
MAIKKKTSSKKAEEKESKKYPRVVTPEGRISFPYLAAPDTGREYSDDKYKADLLIDKEVWKSSPHAKKLKAAVIKVAQQTWPSKGIETLEDFKHPFKNTDSIRNCPENMKNCILIKAKSNFAPIIVGPRKNEDGDFEDLSEKAVKAIKGGDWGRFSVAVVPYTQSGGGVTLCLNVVQFKQEGEPLGEGRSKSLENLDEFEVDVDDLEESEEEEEEKPARKTRGKAAPKKKAKAVEDDEEAPKKRGRPAAKKAKAVEEEEEEEEDEDEEEEEEETPRRRATGRNGSSSKGASAEFEF